MAAEADAHADADGAPVRRRVVVRGEVQGVFFRDSTRREAESRGVAGSVTNRSDGAVEAVFEGPAQAVDAMIEFCRSGPGRSRVEDVEVTEEEPEGRGGGFRVI
jgi:acylphosphatase